MSKAKAAKPPVKRKAKPFRLEVGKTYETRDGRVTTRILRETSMPGTNAMAGEILSGAGRWKNNGAFWSVSGVYHGLDVPKPEKWRDLVREVKPKPRRAK